MFKAVEAVLVKDDVNSNDEHHTDPADALADLARGTAGGMVVPDKAGKVDPLSALDAMARNDAVVADPGEFAAAAETNVSDEVFAGGASFSKASDREHVTAGAGYRRHHAHMYKQTMIPLMLVVGAILVLIAFVAAVMVLQSDTADALYYSRMKIVVYVSFPLSAVVLVGAWWFHRDVNNSN